MCENITMSLSIVETDNTKIFSSLKTGVKILKHLNIVLSFLNYLIIVIPIKWIHFILNGDI